MVFFSFSFFFSYIGQNNYVKSKNILKLDDLINKILVRYLK